MNGDRRTAVAALAAAGLLWGTTVPLSKLALEWLPPGWLTVVRFGLAAAVLLAAGRSRARAAWSPAVLAWGAVGYGGSILVQNAGIARTSVSHAALLVGATPVLVAVVAALRHREVARPVAWWGFAVSFAGVGLVAAGGGGGATLTGDGLVLASLLFSASFTVAQARLLPGRDPVAVTAAQFLAAAVAAAPVAAVTEGAPAAPGRPGALLATFALALAGTLAPCTLFAHGQARVPAGIAGAFVNLEPLVGAVAGAAAFGDPVGLAQAAGAAAILAGIALSSLPLLGRPAPQAPRPAWSPPTRPATIRSSTAPVDDSGGVGPRVPVLRRGGRCMLLANERELIARFGRRMTSDRLVVGTSGNLSIRGGDLLAVTPSGHAYDTLTPELVCVNRLDGSQVEGELAPTSELPFHQLLYAHTDAEAVVHTHSTAATVVSTLVEELPCIHYILAVLGGPVRVAAYATFGSQELADNVLAAIEGRSGALLANHGAVTYGPTIEVAYDRALYLEWVAEVWLRAHALAPAFTPRILGDAEMAEVHAQLGGAHATGGRPRTPPGS